jgi:hypothetical protein
MQNLIAKIVNLMTKIFPSSILLQPILLLFSCTQPTQHMNIQTGDILFCSYQTDGLSNAINEVTQTEKATNYSHMALVELVGTDTFVIHASLKRGVVKETLNKFLQVDQATVVDNYRLVDSLQFSVPTAILQANKWVGLPYNAHYIMNDTSYYCSQLVFEAFKANNIFSLEPMTFKNPATDEFNEGWIKYYDSLGIEIPEGEPGCNPNGLAVSKNLKFVGNLNSRPLLITNGLSKMQNITD